MAKSDKFGTNLPVSIERAPERRVEMPSKVEIRRIDPIFGEVCWLDSRYGQERGNYRRSVADEMARVDDLFEAAGVKPGDRFEFRSNGSAWNGKKRRMDVNPRTWRKSDPHDDVVFDSVYNARLLVRNVSESEPFASRAIGGLSDILEVRKPPQRSKAAE